MRVGPVMIPFLQRTAQSFRSQLRAVPARCFQPQDADRGEDEHYKSLCRVQRQTSVVDAALLLLDAGRARTFRDEQTVDLLRSLPLPVMRGSTHPPPPRF